MRAGTSDSLPPHPSRSRTTRTGRRNARRSSSTSGPAYASPTIVIMPGLLALDGLAARSADRTLSGCRTESRSDRSWSPANAVHMPAACISGDTAYQGGPPWRTFSWISSADVVVRPVHRRQVHVALPPQHAFRPPVVPPVQIMIRSSGEGDASWSVSPCANASSSVIAPGSSGAVVAIVNGHQQVSCLRRSTSANFAPSDAVVDDAPRPDVVEQFADLAGRVVVVDVHRHDTRLQAADDHVGIQVVVHDQRDPVLAALPAVERVALTLRRRTPCRPENCRVGGCAPLIRA